MLRANEFVVGTLADATPLSLMLPRSKYEAPCLIGRVEDSPVAIILDGDFKFMLIECAGTTAWKGILVPNVGIEIDETSLCEAESVRPPAGALLRVDTRLVVGTRGERSIRSPSVVLERNLAPTHDLNAGFLRWRIVIGDGQDKRVLREIDATPQAQ